ncbi:hypothetical protein H257_00841 [Aphanomyces astaci]|uniref:Uncharacterized protein n=1 Tax=Aphanomyces astaci TaxID=112090 RepID=W4HCK3_APHAT|nr:hypothetical protein H257_00841 [Aphanomyces astaci]ETV89637.1 hypothetical protein H257_00841 [Aphanomyces astaci]|eukprot:XP_009822037.1 hypothetical protein H257_00841 [Aphanomyces astaci]
MPNETFVKSVACPVQQPKVTTLLVNDSSPKTLARLTKQDFAEQHVMHSSNVRQVNAPNPLLSAAKDNDALPKDPHDLETNALYSSGLSGVNNAVALPRSGKSQSAAWDEFISIAALFKVVATAVPLMRSAFVMSRDE